MAGVILRYGCRINSAPWCGHCKHSAPEFEKAAEILKGVVNVGAVDMTTDGKAGERYKVSGFPTIKLFGREKETPYDYSSGDRTYEKFVSFSLAKVKAEITERIKQINSVEGEEKQEEHTEKQSEEGEEL